MAGGGEFGECPPCHCNSGPASESRPEPRSVCVNPFGRSHCRADRAHGTACGRRSAGADQTAGTAQEEPEAPSRLAVLVFEAGVSLSAAPCLAGFDTHTDHDAEHGWLLASRARSAGFLWSPAERCGIADRLVVVLGSDSRRTNRSIDAHGKDHWPIGVSVMLSNPCSLERPAKVPSRRRTGLMRHMCEVVPGPGLREAAGTGIPSQGSDVFDTELQIVLI